MAQVTVTVPPRHFAQDDLSNVSDADFLAKAQDAGLASDLEIAAAIAPVVAANAATQAELDAYETSNNADIAALQEGQGTAAVAYTTWAELAAHPTGSLVTGTPGSVLDDAGTHTDPVVGGTVDNEGSYSYVVGDGWQWLSALQSKLAQEAADTAVAAAASVRGPRDLPTTGLLASWAFDEGNGDTVDNIANPGTLDINLAGPTQPNVTRTARGVEMAVGLVETPSLTNLRTFAVLMRTGYAEAAGFLISGGNSSGNGLQAYTIPTNWVVHIGNGWGVHPAVVQVGGLNAGQGAFEQVQGGYVLLFIEMDAAYTTKIGIGGQHSSTGSRCALAGVRWAAGYSTQLTSDERQDIYDAVGAWSARNGVVLRYTDGAQIVDGAILAGESTAEGWSLISGLSAADQAVVYPNVKILPGNRTTRWRASEQFLLGVNQEVTNPTTKLGPEIGLTLAKRANAATSQRELWICKMAQGTTFMSPSGGSVGTGASWNTAEVVYSDISLFYRLLTHIARWEQEARLRGVGIEVKLIEFLIGLNDVALTPSYVADAATYQGWLQDFYDTLMTYTGWTNTKIHLPRAHNHDPAYNATTGPRVRQGQADFVAANAAVAQLLDTDAIPLEPDSVHFTANGSSTIGQLGYAWGGL